MCGFPHRLPMVHLPATISNNVLITEWSLGSYTSIYVLVDACDSIRQSASASRNRVFVVETQGGESGYIALLGGLAAGANIVYTPELPVTLTQLSADVEFFKKRFRADPKGKSQGRLLVRSDKSSSTYTNEVVTKILKEEGDKLFDAQQVSLGHVLQGGVPSPSDRTRAVGMSIKCIQFLERHCIKVVACNKEVETPTEGRNTGLPTVEKSSGEEENFGTIVITRSQIRIAGLKEMVEGADLNKRRGKQTWWWELKKVVEIMSGRLQDGFE
ncbi:uncharacterized protein MELLADRAFT_46505 [Melampsora larici-populina 98AG31]|uniref:6-phosphofructokinase n=1 Tax=Melampsora larici-populina (strain 98AG31 / pathotype 3-4-7) TaxID=747676 RepID=F4R662_MELLP|nr:uncharacterized protein MELLADRAFT_46505 [Melampsora larici-populina 98AG31]EGG11830.1 hypothetical protein MELLADRAFT_46505 [Melampsora larici-populina 98AG31]